MNEKESDRVLWIFVFLRYHYFLSSFEASSDEKQDLLELSGSPLTQSEICWYRMSTDFRRFTMYGSSARPKLVQVKFVLETT